LVSVIIATRLDKLGFPSGRIAVKQTKILWSPEDVPGNSKPYDSLQGTVCPAWRAVNRRRNLMTAHRFPELTARKSDNKVSLIDDSVWFSCCLCADAALLYRQGASLPNFVIEQDNGPSQTSRHTMSSKP
jgi:hypothetical protein